VTGGRRDSEDATARDHPPLGHDLPPGERERRRQRAHAAAAAMFGIEPQHRADFAATFPDCQTPEFVELMIGLAREARSAQPATAVGRLKLALSAAEGADMRGREGIAAARALVMAELGNAYRLVGRLDLAEHALAEARRQTDELGDREGLARIDGHCIQLLFAQGRTQNIPPAIEVALAVAEGISRHALARLRLVAATSVHIQDSLQAVDHFEAGLGRIDARREPRLVGVGLHGLGYRLVRVGAVDDGCYFLRRALEVARRYGSPVDRARLLWVTSWADWMRGSYDRAIDELEIAARRLASLGQPLLAWAAFLDLSRALACRGRWNAAERTALTSLEVFASCQSPQHLSITEIVLSEAGRRGPRSATRVAEAVEALL